MPIYGALCEDMTVSQPDRLPGSVPGLDVIRSLPIPDGSYELAPERHARVLGYLHAPSLFSSALGAHAHPVFAHLANQCGMGWTFDQFLDGVAATPDDGVVIGGGRFDFVAPITVGPTYTVRSRVTDVERKHGRRIGDFDAITVAFDLVDGESLVVTMHETYIVPRGRADAQAAATAPPPPESITDEGRSITAEDITGLADAMGDTNPVHRDVGVARASGFRGLVNQAPANLAYVLNAIALERGDVSELRSASFAFRDAVIAGDRVEVSLEHDERRQVYDGELRVVGGGIALSCHAEFEPWD